MSNAPYLLIGRNIIHLGNIPFTIFVSLLIFPDLLKIDPALAKSLFIIFWIFDTLTIQQPHPKEKKIV